MTRPRPPYYDTHILMWAEHQADILRRIRAGEDVNDQVDWLNVAKEVFRIVVASADDDRAACILEGEEIQPEATYRLPALSNLQARSRS